MLLIQSQGGMPATHPVLEVRRLGVEPRSPGVRARFSSPVELTAHDRERGNACRIDCPLKWKDNRRVSARGEHRVSVMVLTGREAGFEPATSARGGALPAELLLRLG